MLSVYNHFLQELVVPVNLVFRLTFDFGIFPQRLLRVSQGGLQLDGRRTRLRRMRLIYDDCKALTGSILNLGIDNRELLYMS